MTGFRAQMRPVEDADREGLVLGHSSPTITKTIYVDPTKKAQRAVVDRLGFLFDA